MGIYFVVGPTSAQRKRVLKSVYSKLKEVEEVKLIEDGDEDKVEFPAIIFVGSGGTGHLLTKITSKGPCLLIAYSENNSLPSALSGKFRDEGKAKIIYLENFLDLKEDKKVKTWKRIKKLLRQKKNLGIIGGIKKKVDEFERDLMGKLNAELIEIELEEFLSFFNEKEGGVEDKSYYALAKLKEKYKLDGLALRCFDLIPHGFVPCYGMAKLGDEIPCACEGDLQALLTMVLVRIVRDTACFMANTSRINLNKNSVIFAHCTIPFSLIRNIELVNHMESNLPISVRGNFNANEVTVARWNNGKFSITTGKIIANNMKIENLCRMQIEVKLDKRVNEWINSCLGNHQIIVPGNLKEELEEIAFILGLNLV